MGMFDNIYSSYNFGEDFTNVNLQTKDLQSLLDYYWISPKGELFRYDFSESSRLVRDPNHSKSILGLFWEKTGKNGKLIPCYHTAKIVAYPSNYKGVVTKWPEIEIFFFAGLVKGFSNKYRFS